MTADKESGMAQKKKNEPSTFVPLFKKSDALAKIAHGLTEVTEIPLPFESSRNLASFANFIWVSNGFKDGHFFSYWWCNSSSWTK